MRAMVTLALNRTLSEIESFEWARWVAGLIGVEHVLHMHQEPRLSEVVAILGEYDVGSDESCRMDDFFLADGEENDVA